MTTSIYEKRIVNYIPSEKRVPASLLLDKNIIESADKALKILSEKHNISYSRNVLCNVALDIFLEGLCEELKAENTGENQKRLVEDLIIFTSDNVGGEYDNWYRADYWKAVKLSEKRVELIKNGVVKYFALYRGKGKRRKIENLQNIIEYSEIVSINFISSGSDAGKYEFFLKNRTELLTPIELGNVNPMALMRGRTTNLNKFLNAKTIDDLF